LALVAGAVALGGCGARHHAPAPAAPATRHAEQHVLVVTETAGFRHASIPAGVAAVRRLARADGRYDVRVVTHARDLTASRLRRASAIVFLLTSGELPLSNAGKRRLLRFVRSGHGLLGFHSASDTFHHWRAWRLMIGAEFQRHPFRGVGRVVVTDRRHPATRRLPRAFRIAEEFYFFKTSPRRRAHVLARLDVASFGGSAHEDRPLVWCRREGHGRVFYDALGHNSATWSEIHQRRLVAGALAWAIGLRGARAAC
jgi:type 1 glutamine amidotransferase